MATEAKNELTSNFPVTPFTCTSTLALVKLPPLPLVVLDTETTGFVPRVHRVMEFASVQLREGKIVSEYEQLFSVDEIPPHVEVLTQIKTSDLQGRPLLAEKHSEILSHVPKDAIVVGQNIGFDLSMLKGEGIDLWNRPWVDTSMLASLVFPELQSYSLAYLSTVLRLTHEPKHRAMGDVRATVELLSKCWERLIGIPEDMTQEAKAIMRRGPEGYRRLFETLPPSKRKEKPQWLAKVSSLKPQASNAPREPIRLATPRKGEVSLIEEPLDPDFLHRIIAGSAHPLCAAVKNIETAVERLTFDPRMRQKLDRQELRILRPPFLLLDPAARDAFLTQEIFTADEATLAVKLAWYKPLHRSEFPLHGGEDAFWNGKLACTRTSETYLAQFRDLPAVILIDHRQLLDIAADADHPVHRSITEDRHIIIDDASMLEDTATKAYGWVCALDDLRAAAEGNPLLTKFLDTFQLWIEKVRQFQDLRFLGTADLKTPDARGLREQLREVLEQERFTPQILSPLGCLEHILEPENLSHRFAWIEQRQNGSQFLHSVPERIGEFLAAHLFSRFSITLLIPTYADSLPEILPPSAISGKRQAISIDGSAYSSSSRLPSTDRLLHLFLSPDPPLDDVLRSPPSGKTIILIPNRGTIEDLYVKYTEELERKGITLICQGISGGQGRMQAEFLAAPPPALWLITPWVFEGIDLPRESLDHLLLKALPFDHPSHPTVSRRSQQYRDGFSNYCLPRLLHRLFRLLRTFCRFKTDAADVRILDERLHSKEYGKKLKAYLEHFQEPRAGTPATGHRGREGKKEQMSLF